MRISKHFDTASSQILGVSSSLTADFSESIIDMAMKFGQNIHSSL